MARTPTVEVNPTVLVWVRKGRGWSTTEAAHRAGVDVLHYERWEDGSASPTLAQMRNLARAARRPVAFFMLPHTPTTEMAKPPDFRGVGSATPPAVMGEIAKAEARRETFLDIAREATPTKLPDSPDPALARTLLGVSVGDVKNTPDHQSALRQWIRALEEIGVLVFQMSRIQVDECRAFSIAHDNYPVIVLNGADSATGRTFSLMHEFAHIIERTGGICSLVDAGAERRCNRFAADLLMPETDVRGLRHRSPMTAEEWVSAVSRDFRVSRHASAIRLAELGILERTDVPMFADAAQRASGGSGGPAPHVITRRNLGDRYLGAILDAYHRDTITLAHTAHFLETQARNIPKLEAAGGHR